YLRFKGTLTRENAPGLPWVDGCDYVLLGDPHRDGVPDVSPEIQDWDTFEDLNSDYRKAVDKLDDAVQAAIRDAWKAGRVELDYLEGEEYTIDMIEANEYEFTIDGKFYGGQTEFR